MWTPQAAKVKYLEWPTATIEDVQALAKLNCRFRPTFILWKKIYIYIYPTAIAPYQGHFYPETLIRNHIGNPVGNRVEFNGRLSRPAPKPLLWLKSQAASWGKKRFSLFYLFLLLPKMFFPFLAHQNLGRMLSVMFSLLRGYKAGQRLFEVNILNYCSLLHYLTWLARCGRLRGQFILNFCFLSLSTKMNH